MPSSTRGRASGDSLIPLLCDLGWEAILPAGDPAAPAATSGSILSHTLSGFLQQPGFEHRGRRHVLSPASIGQVTARLSAIDTRGGLQDASDRVHDALLHGVPVMETLPDGTMQSVSASLVDWDDPAANAWQVCCARHARAIHGSGVRAPSVTCYLNGIPVVAIEVAATTAQAIRRHALGYKMQTAPSLLASVQLLVAWGQDEDRCKTALVTHGQWTQGTTKACVSALAPRTLLAFLKSVGVIRQTLAGRGAAGGPAEVRERQLPYIALRWTSVHDATLITRGAKP